MELDEDQYKAVHHEGDLVCIAGPGSGKTRTIVSKAVHLLQKYEEGFICTVTYTKNAAAETATRILDSFPQAKSRLMSGTFHSLAGRQLRNAGIKYRIAKDGELNYYIRNIMTELQMDEKIDDVKEIIALLKSRVNPPKNGEMYYDLYIKYENILRKNSVYDFSDLIINATNGMKSGKVNPLPVRWLLVDEYQDSDPVQYEWIKTQAVKQNTEVTVVGDDDQSIYAWRSAMGYDGIKKFQNDHNAEIVLLNTNYRCGKTILEKAANLICYNNDRVAKSIKPFSGSPEGIVEYYLAQDRIGESETIRDLILADPGNWAVLSRTNRLLDQIELALNVASIPVIRLGGEGFWDQQGSQMIMELCQTVSRNKWNGFSHVLNNFQCKIEQIEALQNWLGKKTCSKWEFGKRRKGMPDSVSALFPVGDATSEEAVRLLHLVQEWSVLEKEGFTDLVLLGISTWSSDSMPKMFKGAGTAAANSLAKLKGTLRTRLEFISNLVKSKESNPDQVNLITLHSSKGMEFDKVIMMAVEQGNCPSLKNANMEEERRLAYVGMTRAKKRLIITRTTEMSESQFIQEAGITSPNLILKSGG